MDGVADAAMQVRAEYKLSGLYVIDSIVNNSRKVRRAFLFAIST